MAIVRKEFKLKDPQNTQEVDHPVDLIVAQNRTHIPHLTRDRVKAGDTLALRY